MELDLHGFEIADAIVEIIQFLRECKLVGARTLTIIHGYHGGHVLRDYLRSPKFIIDMKKQGFSLSRQKIADPGSTSFLL
jgi:hypothetical protein